MIKLSVLTTIFNGEDFIDEMFESIISQTFKDFEWIIIDDGSTDSTWEKLKKYNDKRIKLFRLDSNRGVGFASHYALSLARGEYIAKVDVDDLSMPTRFEKQISFLNDNPTIDLIDTFVQYFPDNKSVSESARYKFYEEVHEKYVNQYLSVDEISEELYWNCIIINSAMMARKDSVLSVGYSCDLKQGEDYLLYYEMNKAGMKFYKINEILVKVRISGVSTTSSNWDKIDDIKLNIKSVERNSFLINDKRPLIIWGAGKNGKDTLNYIHQIYGIKPSIFFDSDKTKAGKSIEGIAIEQPRNFKGYKICVASSYGQNEIIKTLKEQNYKPLIDYYVVL
ncbi:glycosyltransferase [Sporosarcina sp. PTS2304]|uniref:glycosyltransferase n=1 Tax=Sporosarcina sp. PTS2304 TaxID=2283194 RepID=UPI000E0D185A|nr:glycosyltransferase [Sporosarcina sp. PTS2304]AXH98439.1 glycosyltransferase [Sporosarcina sp. PTS2304]